MRFAWRIEGGPAKAGPFRAISLSIAPVRTVGDMPQYRTAVIITLAVATLGLDARPSHSLTHVSVATFASQIAKSANNGSPPARIGNIWGGFNHQPTASEVQDREKAAGISLSTAQQERESAILDDIYKQLASQRPSGAAQ
jgi:hypothetical protein